MTRLEIDFNAPKMGERRECKFVCRVLQEHHDKMDEETQTFEREIIGHLKNQVIEFLSEIARMMGEEQ